MIQAIALFIYFLLHVAANLIMIVLSKPRIGLICIFAVTLLLFDKLNAYMICPNGYVCEGNDEKICCPAASTNVSQPFVAVTSTLDIRAQHNTSDYDELFEQWYSIWTLILVAVLLSFASLIIWCIHHCLVRYMGIMACYCECCHPRHPQTPSEHDSAGSCCPPPRYSRCSSLYRMPPAYSEVTSKPDMYPLVITCGNNDKGYLMVQYFRSNPNNIHSNNDLCPLSTTSTPESINSSNLCNTANEANSIIPPPYSYAAPEDRRSEDQQPVRTQPAVITPPRRRLPPTPYHRTHSDTSCDPEVNHASDEEVIAINPVIRTVVFCQQPEDYIEAPDTDSDTESNESLETATANIYKNAGLVYVATKKKDITRGIIGYVNELGYKLRVTSAPTTPDDANNYNMVPCVPKRGNSSTPRLNAVVKGDDDPPFYER